jgi:hypothetical protein
MYFRSDYNLFPFFLLVLLIDNTEVDMGKRNSDESDEQKEEDRMRFE